MTECTCNANQGRGPCPMHEPEFPNLTGRSTLVVAVVIVLVTIFISVLLPLGFTT